MEKSIEHNEKKCRIDLIVDGQAGGYLTYEIYNGCLDIQHTVVDSSLRGHGLGKILLDTAVEYAGLKDLKIIPTCSYAANMLKNK